MIVLADHKVMPSVMEPWPELTVPATVKIDCETFGLGGHGRLVWAEGNESAPVMLLLDNPGARETPEGEPFVCGTRQTLRAAATKAGLDPDHLYVTFLIKCRPRRAYDREKARSVGLKYVREQIRTRQPKVIVLFGDVVTGVLTGDDSTSVRSLRNTPVTVDGVPTVVTYHPLAARRRPNLYPLVVDDLTRAAALLQPS